MTNVNIFYDKVKGEVNPMLYGQMVEHAYWSVHQGLCTQMLDNGGFELDRDKIHYHVAEGWRLTSTSQKNVFSSKLDDERPYNAKYSQKISVDNYVEGELRLQQNFIAVKENVNYKGFVFLKGKINGCISLALFSVTKKKIAEQEFGKIDHQEWKKYEFDLSSSENCHDAAFAIIVEGEGTLWIDQAMMYPSDSYMGHGTRADMAELYKGLKPPFLRWPGGSYLVWHHWKNGIGPLENRYAGDGRRLDNRGISHFGEWDPNTFGTDEYIQFCKDMDTEPMINVNIKDGLQNTLDWIEYCNGDATTEWGAARARYGHPEPYKIKYWVVDNEPLIMTEKKGYNKELFPIAARVWAEEMKKKDPSIMVLIMGNHDMHSYIDVLPMFSKDVIKETKDVIDRLCVHLYYDQTVYGPLQGMPYKMGEGIGRLKSMIDDYCGDRDVKVFLSEWNPESNTNIDGNMGQALEAAQMFHVLERKCSEGAIDMATPCQLCVNVDRYRGYWLRSAMVQINNHTAWTNPMYHVNQLYAGLCRPYLLEIDDAGIPFINSQVFEGYSFPALDIVSTKGNNNKELIIKAVNNSADQTYEIKFNIQSFGNIRSVKVYEVSSENILDMNTASIPDKVVLKERQFYPGASEFVYAFGPNSVTALELHGE